MPFPLPQTEEFLGRLSALTEDCRAELEGISQSLHEISLLINQSASEVERLTQRENAMANRVREMEANLESYARKDIRELYLANHEVALRLMIMRSQVEQLEEREKSIRAYQEKLRILLELAEAQLKAEEERKTPSDGLTRVLRRGGTTAIQPNEVPFSELIQAQEDERLRVAQYVVDGPAQTLANLLLQVEICNRTFERSPDAVQDELAELRDVATRALRDTRLMLFELRPVVLKELGVVPTLRRYASEVSRNNQVEITVIGPESDEKLHEVMRIALYRLMQQMIAAIVAEPDVRRVDVDVRYEDAQIVGRVEGRSDNLGRSQSVARFLGDNTLRRRLDQISADLQHELTGSNVTRLTLIVPLG